MRTNQHFTYYAAALCSRRNELPSSPPSDSTFSTTVLQSPTYLPTTPQPTSSRLRVSWRSSLSSFAPQILLVSTNLSATILYDRLHTDATPNTFFTDPNRMLSSTTRAPFCRQFSTCGHRKRHTHARLQLYISLLLSVQLYADVFLDMLNLRPALFNFCLLVRPTCHFPHVRILAL